MCHNAPQGGVGSHRARGVTQPHSLCFAAPADSRARFTMTAPPETTALPGTTAPPGTPAAEAPTGTRRVPIPEIDAEPTSRLDRFLVGVFVVIPLLAVAAAVPLAWGSGLGWHDIVIALVFYVVSGMGISMGFHRYFTHSSFKAVRGARSTRLN